LKSCEKDPTFNRGARGFRREFLAMSLCDLGGLGGCRDVFTRSWAASVIQQ